MLTFEDKKTQPEQPIHGGVLNNAQALTSSDQNLKIVSPTTNTSNEQPVDNAPHRRVAVEDKKIINLIKLDRGKREGGPQKWIQKF